MKRSPPKKKNTVKQTFSEAAFAVRNYSFSEILSFPFYGLMGQRGQIKSPAYIEGACIQKTQ